MSGLYEDLEKYPTGHPVRVYLEENQLLRKLLEELMHSNAEEDLQKLINVFNQISQIEKHFLRKENQLFPVLEMSQDITDIKNIKGEKRLLDWD